MENILDVLHHNDAISGIRWRYKQNHKKVDYKLFQLEEPEPTPSEEEGPG